MLRTVTKINSPSGWFNTHNIDQVHYLSFIFIIWLALMEMVYSCICKLPSFWHWCCIMVLILWKVTPVWCLPKTEDLHLSTIGKAVQANTVKALSALGSLIAGFALLMSPITPIELLWIFQTLLIPLIVTAKVGGFLSFTWDCSHVYSLMYK